ncbi:coiled-coil domain-containing protein 127 [Varanus komodoensis]|uniref:Coiled-coil domain containing 127 n=1 Tax=Varanus komodoensis TaxID=61221 RepID=A0A8D2JIF4_VARKO|nr:coiled-coil domain-containing protein 127 [Varanus komodoensis]XP_044308099.1 coiled-coil domain-containing protein 127 [Varanus komodoensis]XP_044308109.1 coiled-coil domain-containing protein 127 [Varanus komodoensis]XP_044308119.1 coiled-coil domain-containing protein 127 [Varanus komodoensis]
MNNLNDPPNWNIQPNERNEGGHGSKWNYALLVPMVGLAAFRWIWSRESQKEIEKERKKFYRKLLLVQKELESKYHDIITENRRTVAHLELEMEKARNRTESFRKALISQTHKLVEERKTLEQERTKLEQEKQIMQYSGAASALYQSCLEKEEQWQNQATTLLKEFEGALTERQNIYCSLLLPRQQRLEIEKTLLVRAATDPVALDLGMETGLRDIFKYDTSCSNWLNTNKRQNGKLMWLYLRYWELSVELNKFKRVEKVILGKSRN